MIYLWLKYYSITRTEMRKISRVTDKFCNHLPEKTVNLSNGHTNSDLKFILSMSKKKYRTS